jgi:hypothetical protein
MEIARTNRKQDEPENRVLRLPTPSDKQPAERLTRIGGQVLPDGQRKLMELIFQKQEEPVDVGEVDSPEVKYLCGWELAYAYVAKAMRVVYQVIGIRPERHPEKALGKTINRYVCQVYPHFTVEDIYEAFIQAVAEKLDVDYKHWGEVNLEYLNRVWKAYDQHAYRKPQPARHLYISSGPSTAIAKLKAERPVSDKAIKGILRDYYSLRLAGNPKHSDFLSMADEIFPLLQDAGLVWLTAEERKSIYLLAEKRVSQEQGLSLDTVREKHVNKCNAEAFRMALGFQLVKMEERGITLEMLDEELERLCYVGLKTHHKLAGLLGSQEPGRAG